MASVMYKATPTSSKKGKSPKKPGNGDSKCGGCSVQVKATQRAVACDLCETWFHIGCHSVSPDEYRLYSNEDCRAKWFCLKCEKIFKSLKKEKEALVVEVSELKKVNSELTEKVKDLEKKDGVDKEVQTEVPSRDECADKTVQTEVSVKNNAKDRADKSSQTVVKEPVAGPRKIMMRKRVAPIRIIGDSIVKKTHVHVRCERKDSGCTSMSGARIEEVKKRVQEEAGDMKDGLLVIQGGGNGLEYVGKDDTVKEMLDAVRAVEGKNISVAVVGVLKRPREDPQYEWLRRSTNRKLQEELMKLKIEWKKEKKGDVSFIDMDHVLRENRCFSRDGVHLSDEGDARMGRRLCEWVRAKSMRAIENA